MCVISLILFRNGILWLRRKILTSCKSFNRLSLRMHTLLQTRHDPRIMSIHLRLMGIMGFAMTVFFLLYFSMKNNSVTPEIEEYGPSLLKSFMERYELKRLKFHAMLEANEIRSLKAYRNMLKNSMNSRRILQIIEEESRDITNLEDHPSCVTILPDCPLQPPHLRGRLPAKAWIVEQRKKMLREQQNYTYPRHAGMWSPEQCTSRHSVAIIIPYRNRVHQLHLLLQHLPTLLKRQQISYNIFVVEQLGNKTFNKGILMNAGFMTALTRPAHGVMYHCFIFHDADLLTEDDRNMYTCPEFPRHMSVAVDELGYELPYQELVGGVFAIRTDHFIEVNGYSNLYWGWGGEDDDMGLRVEKALMWKLRPSEELGRFTTIPHIKQTPFLPVDMRRNLKKTAKKRYHTDGLSSVKFTLEGIIERQQFTHVFVDVGDPPKNYQHLLDFGNTRLERTLVQKLLERYRKWHPKHQTKTREF